MEQNVLVDGPMVFCSTKSWTNDAGAIIAKLFIAVPTTEAEWLEVEARMNTPLEAALLAVVLVPK